MAESDARNKALMAENEAQDKVIADLEKRLEKLESGM